MLSSEIRQRYLKFFEKRGHTVIPSSSLVPENDPSSLFTTAGMQPLVPYLLGAKHPGGSRLVDVQKCVRTGDIDDVGDNRHLTFFEMMGNWSLGDYFKKESIAWSMEFLTSKEEGLGLDPKRLFVTVFKGEDGIPRDEESILIWKETFNKHNIKAEVANVDEIIKDEVRIIPLGKEDNFWIAGQVGPCGGDTEMFYDVRPQDGKVEGKFADLVKSGRIIEIWNNVFMEFNKTADGKYVPLAKKNVDTGMGLERTTVVMQGKTTVFDTDIFEEILSVIRKNSKRRDEKAERIIADHIRSAVMMIADGVSPSNTEAGYVLRRLIRRAIRNTRKIEFENSLVMELVSIIVKGFEGVYDELKNKYPTIFKELNNEIEKLKLPFDRLDQFKLDITAAVNSKILKKIKEYPILNSSGSVSGAYIFQNYQMYGVPADSAIEIAEELNIPVNTKEYEEEMKKHQEISKVGSEQKFKGGLAGHGETETRYHTATHLLLASLRRVLKGEITQKGSNITTERMRFDFNWPEKLTPEQLKAVEDMVNEKIQEKIPVQMLELQKEEAKKIVTTLSFDLSKYGDVVKVYKIGDFSTEFCGGPHVSNTSELGHFKIIKEEASSAGVRRIKAILE